MTITRTIDWHGLHVPCHTGYERPERDVGFAGGWYAEPVLAEAAVHDPDEFAAWHGAHPTAELVQHVLAQPEHVAQIEAAALAAAEAEHADLYASACADRADDRDYWTD